MPLPMTMLTLDSPLAAAAGALLALAAVAAGWRAAVPRSSGLLLVMGLAVLALAAGGPQLDLPRKPRIAMMLDLSASTRGAFWRDAEAFAQLREQVEARGEVAWYAFASSTTGMTREGKISGERPAQGFETRLRVPAGMDAALVLTDGRLRFDAPPAAPTTLAIDPAPLAPADAAVTGLYVGGAAVVATARSTVQGARLAFADREWPIPGSAAVRAERAIARTTLAQIAANDDYPENDVVRLPAVAAEEARRLWIGDAPAPGGFVELGAVPEDSALLADASVLVLANLPADALSPAAGRALREYVADLGGAVVLLGGERAFGAGAWAGTALEALSPLSSRPPVPEARWVLLADASGSMAAEAGGRTRFAVAAEALARALGALPEEARVDIGSFAAGLQWWTRGTRAADASAMSLPPASARTGGPTNLGSALRQVAADLADEALPVEVIVITDAQVPLEDTGAIAESLRQARITLNVVNVGDAPSPALVKLVESTGGRLASAAEPHRWAEAARELVAGAGGPAIERGEATVRFSGELGDISPLALETWNRAWPKRHATLLVEDEAGPLAARWQVGLGQVSAFAFAPPAATAEALATRLEATPLSSSAEVEWLEGPALRVRVRAAGARSVLIRRDEADHAATMTAPGVWEAEIPAPREPAVAVVGVDGRVVERRATAGRYAPEFELAPTTMAELAARFEPQGVGVISTDELARWRPPARYRRVPLTATLALGGAALAAAALVVWRLRPAAT